MMMMVDLEKSDITIDELRTKMNNTAQEMGVEINIMSEKVFSAMHNLKGVFSKKNSVRNIVVFFKIRDKIIICITDHLNITV